MRIDTMFRSLEIADFEKGFPQTLHALSSTALLSRDRFVETYETRKSQGIITIVGVVDNAVVCTASYFVETKFIHQGSKVIHVEDVAVNDNFQKQGYGKKIMDHLEQLALLQGCYKMILNCEEKNIPFYEKCGFVRYETEMRKNLKQ